MSHRVRYHVAASLDGFIAGPDGGTAWLEPYHDGGEFMAFIAGIAGIVMGRSTWETMAGFGPWDLDPPTVVMTNAHLDLPVGVAAFAGDPAQALASLPPGDIWLAGGGVLAGAMLRAGLLDVLELTTIPVLLGAGRPLFDAVGATAFELIETGRRPSGGVMAMYRPVAKP